MSENVANTTFERFWPYLEAYLNGADVKALVETKSKGWAVLDSIQLGQPPKVLQCNTCSDSSLHYVYNDAIVYKLEVDIPGIQVNVSAAHIPVGVKVSFKSVINLIVGELTSEIIPLFEAICIYLPQLPSLDLDFKGAAGILDMPGVEGQLNDLINGIMTQMLVYPNRIAIPVSPSVAVAPYRYPSPCGILRVKVASLKQLSDKHEVFGTPEYYYTLTHRGCTLRSATKDEGEGGDTQWRTILDVPVGEAGLESLELKMYEEDMLMSDDLVGSVSFPDLRALIQDKDVATQKEYELQGDKTGKAAILFQFIPFSPRVKSPLACVMEEMPAKYNYFLKIWISDIDSKDAKLVTEAKDFYFVCLENQLKFKSLEVSYSRSKEGKYAPPMAADILFIQVPVKTINLGFASDSEASKGLDVAEWKLDGAKVKGLAPGSITKLPEVTVQGVGKVTMLAKLIPLEHSMSK